MASYPNNRPGAVRGLCFGATLWIAAFWLLNPWQRPSTTKSGTGVAVPAREAGLPGGGKKLTDAVAAALQTQQRTRSSSSLRGLPRRTSHDEVNRKAVGQATFDPAFADTPPSGKD